MGNPIAPNDSTVATSDSMQINELPHCSKVSEVWKDFVDTFVDFAVGGYVLGRKAQETATVSPTFYPKAEKIIAVGDVHGDLSKLRCALRLAQLTDENDRWIGKSTVLVQVGDQLDRGDEELRVLYFLEKLKREAERDGGKVHCLLGNHETGNITGWFTYATPGGFREFDRWAAWTRVGNKLKKEALIDPTQNVPPEVPSRERSRFAALAPGGPISSRLLAPNPAILVIGSSLFVHGGILPEHVDYGLERINREARDWILGGTSGQGGGGTHAQKIPRFFVGREAVVWLRKFSERRESECDCELLSRTLSRMLPEVEVDRMVVGHTIQQPKGINAACGGHVVRTDVGMSRGCYNASPEVVEILDDTKVTVLTRSGVTRPLENGKVSRGLAEVVEINAAIGAS